MPFVLIVILFNTPSTPPTSEIITVLAVDVIAGNWTITAFDDVSTNHTVAVSSTVKFDVLYEISAKTPEAPVAP